MKKVLAIVLSVAMLLSVLSVNVFAANDGYLFKSADYTTLIDGVNGTPLTQWYQGVMDGSNAGADWKAFYDACATEGAIIEVVTTPGTDNKNVTGISLQDGSWQHWIQHTNVISIETLAGGKTAVLFDGNAFATQADEAGNDFDSNGAGNIGIETTEPRDGSVILWELNVRSGNVTPASKVSINEEEFFDTLVEAVEAAEDGDTIYLHESMEGAGIGIFAPDVKDITIDFGGNTYTCVGPAVGSTGTQSQAFHLEKSADYTPNVTFKNGTITAETGKNVKMLIQNYCNLKLTDMNLIGTTDTTYVLSNNFGNTVIDGNTSITATAGNVAFDVCYANGSYEDGVSVTVDTTGTITGIIELGTWNAAGAATGAPDINDYLENANLTINNVKLDGEIRNVVTGTYEPDPEVYSSPAGLELFISTMSDINAPSVATVTNENGDSTEIAGPGKYKVTYTPTTEITSYDWIMIKSAGSTGQSVAASSIPQGTTIRTTSLKINGSTISFPNDAESVDYTVGTNGQVELKYYFSLNWGGEIFTTKPSETISSIEIEFEIVENEKTEEEIAAELKDKLTKTVEIKGGVFAEDSKVKDYLPEGDYETDNEGNIVIGDVVDDEVDYSHIKLTGGCVYLNENYHAFIVNGRFLAGYHIDNGSGFCPLCRAEINTTPAE